MLVCAGLAFGLAGYCVWKEKAHRAAAAARTRPVAVDLSQPGAADIGFPDEEPVAVYEVELVLWPWPLAPPVGALDLGDFEGRMRHDSRFGGPSAALFLSTSERRLEFRRECEAARLRECPIADPWVASAGARLEVLKPAAALAGVPHHLLLRFVPGRGGYLPIFLAKVAALLCCALGTLAVAVAAWRRYRLRSP